MDRRVELHNLLKKSGVKDCWFQPPDGTKMAYPAITYRRKNSRLNYADNKVYKKARLYEIKLFDPDPDSKLVDWLIDNVPGIQHNNNFSSNNLNVDVFSVYW